MPDPENTPEPEPDAVVEVAKPAPADDAPVMWRQPMRWGAIAVTVALAVTAVCGCMGVNQSWFGDATPSTSTPSPSDSAHDRRDDKLPPFDKASDGDVEIVDKGYSQIPDVGDDDMVTWGATVKNTSKKMVAAVSLKLAFLDDNDKSLNKEKGEYALDPAVPVILPGKTAGIGDALYMDGPGAATMKLKVDEVFWYPLDGDNPQFEALKVSKIKGKWIGKGDEVPYWGEGGVGSHTDQRGDLSLTFRVDSQYDRLLPDANGSAIFRDGDGKVVGGSPLDDFDDKGEIPPGWSQQFIRVRDDPPRDFVESATEVYVYPGLRY